MYVCMYGIVWYCMVLYGIVWYRMVSYGIVWYRIVSHLISTHLYMFVHIYTFVRNFKRISPGFSHACFHVVMNETKLP